MQSDLSAIRRLIITALFADDMLLEKLVLKGGNALNLVYKLSTRSSFDLDFSIKEDFENIEEVKGRMLHSLQDRFDSAGYVCFDFDLTSKPQPPPKQPDKWPWWGGYELSFKIIEKDKHERLGGKLKKLRTSALAVGPNQQRTFTIDLSKHEYTEGKIAAEVDYYKVYVYTPAMLAAEKLRAICQQMPEYAIKTHGIARARDFYDIHLILTKLNIDLTDQENQELIRNIFAAKQVPLMLLGLIPNQREFHRLDWPAVVSSVGEKVDDFDVYFDFVVGETERLKSLWIENS